MKTIVALIIMAGVAALPNPSPAAEHLVRNADELEDAVKAAKPGDTIVMADGRWNDAELEINNKGTEQAPITLRAQTPGKVLLTGKSSLRIGGEYNIVDGLHFTDGGLAEGNVIAFRTDSDDQARHCRLTRTAITDYAVPYPKEGSDEKLPRAFWVSVYGEHNRVDHCSFTGMEMNGVTLCVWPENGKPAYHQIDHNYFGPRSLPPDYIKEKNGYETIRIGTSGVADTNARCTVEYNVFEHADGEGEIVSSKSCENIYRYNTFRNCMGALTLRHGHRCVVEGNFFFEDAGENTNSGGVRVIGEDHRIVNNYFEGLTGTGFTGTIVLSNGQTPETYQVAAYQQVLRGVIAFNTIVDCAQPLMVGLRAKDPRYPDPPKDTTIANNVVQVKGGSIITAEGPMVNTTWQANIFHGGELGMEAVDGIREADPKLVRGEGSLMRPAAGSPLIDGGEGTFELKEDIEGQMRSAPFDIGADERSESAVTRGPLTRADVGPDWLAAARQ